MKLHEVIWKEQYLAKLEVKHNVYVDEVEAVLFRNPIVLRAERGHIKGENLRRPLPCCLIHLQRSGKSTSYLSRRYDSRGKTIL